LLRRDKLHQLTTDHTRIQELIDAGLVREPSDQSSALERGLTRLLGDSVWSSRPSVRHLQLTDGDCLLLCTDGLTNMVPDNWLADMLNRRETSEETCQQLIKAALAAGGRDNVTVAVARYRFPNSSS
jgi:protein phosphatase